jgi:hypothetical protein
MKRWLVIAAVALVLAGGIASPGRIIVANVDGPPVIVDVVGVTHFKVDCPGSQTFWVPLQRFGSHEVIVTNARTGSVLRDLTVAGEVAIVVRRDAVVYGAPGSSYGPAPVNGCD